MQCLCNFFLAASLLLTSATQAQLMRKLSDVQKLKERETLFIGKPLEKLLKEIGPEIRMASAQSNRPDNLPGLIFFKFVDAKEYYKREKGKLYTTVIVSIKENFDWDARRNSKSEDYTWIKEDEKKFGSLTVVRIGVLGEN